MNRGKRMSESKEPVLICFDYHIHLVRLVPI